MLSAMVDARLDRCGPISQLCDKNLVPDSRLYLACEKFKSSFKNNMKTPENVQLSVEDASSVQP